MDELLKRPVLDIAIRQRAKFEGWLKIEFAHALEKRGASVALEAEVPSTKFRADIRADYLEDITVFIMLKTNNSNFRFPGIIPRHRPVTKNFVKTSEDIDKLRPVSDTSPAFVVFTFFPVASSADKRVEQVNIHLTRLLENGCARLIKEGFVIPP